MLNEVKPAWNRFTLVDGVVLVAALGLGVWLQTSWMSRRTDHPFQRAETLVLWAGLSLLQGGVLAGPLVAVAQFLRGRRTAPSAGEWCWLVPIPLYLTFLALLYSGQPGLLQTPLNVDWASCMLLLYASVQGLLSLGALVRLVMSFSRRRPDAACRWTDRLGCLVCAAVGPVMTFLLVSSLRQNP
jgi:hypothetical protein